MKTTKQNRLIVWACMAFVFTYIPSTFAQKGLTQSSEKTAGTASSKSVTLPVQRTLVDTKGRKIDAMILSVEGGSVVLRRTSDNKEFTIDLKRLSKGDQNFLSKLVKGSESKQKEELHNEQTKSNNTKTPGSPPEAALQPELTQKLLRNIPPLENQLEDLTTAANQLLDNNQKKEGDTLLKKIDKARDGNLKALVHLSRYIRSWQLRDLPDRSARWFSVLRLALGKEDPMAIMALNELCDKCDWVPAEFIDEAYSLILDQAKKGNPKAMSALGFFAINRHDKSKLPKEISSLSYMERCKFGCEWSEKAASLTKDSKNFVGFGYYEYLAKGYYAMEEYEKAFPYLIKCSEAGNQWVMYRLARAYEFGRGCDRDLAKAAKWYEKATQKGLHFETDLARVKNQIKYGRGALKATFNNVDFSLETFGLEDARKAVVIFGPTSFTRSISSFHSKVAELEPLFQDGWRVIVVSYPKTDLFTSAGGVASMWLHRPKRFKRVDFTGFGEAVFNPIKKSGRFDRIVLLGNSLGAGAMAWDLEKIQKSQNVSVLWVSPTEVFLPKYAKLKALKGIKVVANLKGDPFVRSTQLKKWIRSNTAPVNSFGELPIGHLILGGNLPWVRLCDYLTKQSR